MFVFKIATSSLKHFPQFRDTICLKRIIIIIIIIIIFNSQVEGLREVRRKLEARVKVMAEEQKLPSPETLLADAPLFYKTRRFWRYFSPKRRRKTEWGEVGV